MTRPHPSRELQKGAELQLLLQGVLERQPEAIDQWFRSEHPLVYRLCFGFLADANEAEDVAQDAMLQLFDKLHSWDSARPYGSWRDTLVLNRCRDRQRRNAARGRAEARLADREAEQAAPGIPDAHELMEREEVQALMRASLAALTPREREVFVLRDLEERSSLEVAELLGITVSSVRSMLTLARRRLRGILEQRMPGLVPEGGERG